MTIKVERNDSTICEPENNISNNNNTANSNTLSSVSDTVNPSLDSVVQRLIDKKMGRRKQNCPQKTGLSAEDGKTLRSYDL